MMIAFAFALTVRKFAASAPCVQPPVALSRDLHRTGRSGPVAANGRSQSPYATFVPSATPAMLQLRNFTTAPPKALTRHAPAVFQRPPEPFGHAVIDRAALAMHRYLHLCTFSSSIQSLLVNCDPWDRSQLGIFSIWFAVQPSGESDAHGSYLWATQQLRW